jgi:hyperosmotically inducible protein
MRRRTSFLLMLALSALASPAQTSSHHTRERLIRQVRHELVLLPYYGVFDHLAFWLSTDAKITLLGQVTRPTLKSDAEAAVRRVEGVAVVENRVEVLPLSPQDDRIRQDAFRAIYGHDALMQYRLRAVPPIHIVVKNGHLTLEGTVARAGDRNIAGIQARRVPGVFSVKNNLSILGK